DLGQPLAEEFKFSHDHAAILVYSTKHSGLRIASAMDHLIDGPDPRIETHVFNDGGAVTAAAVVTPRQRLTMGQFVGYGWSGRRAAVGGRGQVWAAMTAGRATGWEGLLADQRGVLDGFLGRAEVEIGGDSRVQAAVRFALFPVLQAGVRGESRPI